MTTVALQLPQLGEIIGEGRFELLRQLGEGGMSTVFVAADRFRGSEVALKLLTPRYVGRPEREQRLINEADYLRRVQDHPNIVEFVDSGRLGDRHGWPWLTTEILHGEVLAWLFIHGKIEIPQVVAIARQIALALDACHGVGVVHRDITPNNVFMLEDQRTVKLFDFSHGADLLAPKLAVGAPERLTQVFDTPGTIGYMGPEQVINAHPDVSMDAFSFGVLLFKLVTGRNPYQGYSDRNAYIRAQRDGTLETPRLHAWAYDAPEALAELVHDCIQRDGSKRPTMAEIVARLDALEVEPVQDDDATTWFRPASPGNREPIVREAEDVAVGVDTTGSGQPEVTAHVDAPTLIRRRERRAAAPDVIGSWVSPAIVPVAEATLPVENPEDSDPADHTAVELAFARPPHMRGQPASPVSPIAEPQPIVGADPGPAPSEPACDHEELPEDESEAPSKRRLVVIIVAVIATLAIVAWVAFDRWGVDASERESTEPSDPNGGSPPHVAPSEPAERPEPGPALELVPEIDVDTGDESSPAVQPPQPEPRPKPKPKPKPAPSETEPKPKSDAPAAQCDGVEQNAHAAADKAKWRKVASLTASKSCWSSSAERTDLRVRAMFELGNWKECKALGENSTNPRIHKYVKHCQSLAK